MAAGRPEEGRVVVQLGGKEYAVEAERTDADEIMVGEHLTDFATYLQKAIDGHPDVPVDQRPLLRTEREREAAREIVEVLGGIDDD